MDIPPPLKLHLWLLLMMTLVLSLCLPTFTISWNEFDSPFDHSPSIMSTSYTYNRFHEIQHRCGSSSSSSTLFSSSSAVSPLAPDDDRGSRIRNELSFVSGDWVQEAGGSPLPPFGHDDPQSTSSSDSLFKLASFQVTDVDSVRRSNNMVSLSGRLVLSLTNGPGFHHRSQSDNSFGGSSMGSPGVSVHLEGVYFEVNGERVMCFLGNTSMPSSMNQPNIELVGRRRHELQGCNCKEESNQQAPVVQNDQIMLVLRYPKVFTFSSRGVWGEMTSFGRKSDGNYFNKVYISSQLSSPSKYRFSADEQLLSEVCSSNLDQKNKVKLYEGGGFCYTLKDILNSEILDLVVRSTGSSNNRSSSQLWPFTLESSTTSPLGLLIHHVQCQERDDRDVKAAKVAAVLRIVRSSDQFGTNRGRTGLSAMTLSAEGIWRSGRDLCMVACVGSITQHHNSSITNSSCYSRVSLSIPLELSITRRRLIFASVSSINGENETSHFPPLLFQKVIHPRELSYRYYMKQSYKYSELVLEQARNLERRQKRSSLLDLGFSPLKYPSLSSNEASPSLAHLADALTINVGAVELEVLSLGSFIRGEQSNHLGNHNAPSNEEEEEEEDSMIEVSGLLKLKAPYDISLSFEGIYSQLTGQMHLVGCRDIEDRMDCEYEMRVEYPSTNTRWLLNPKARISINSKRDKVDPFYYSPSIALTTHPIPSFTNPRDDILFREKFETTLQVLMLGISVQLIHRQLNFMDKKSENPTINAASVSLVMVAFQAFGYGIPLLTSKQATFTKILLLCAFLLNLKLWNKVKQSRASHNQRALLNLRDIKSFFITSAILAAGFLFLHSSLFTNSSATKPFNPMENYFPDKVINHRSRDVTMNGGYGVVFQEVEGYAEIVHDMFLVPQAIGNALQGSSSSSSSKRALTGSYYIGFTVLRVLLKVYECVRDPVLDGKESFYDGEATIMKDYYGDLRNMIVAAGVVLVAVVVHLQQQQKCHDEDQEKVDRKGRTTKAVSVVDQDLDEELLLSGNGSKR